MSIYKCLLWDLDATLLDFKYAQRYSILQSFQNIGKTADDEMVDLYDKINDFYWKKLERGETTKEALLYDRFVEFFDRLGMKDVDAKAFQADYESTLSTVYRYMDDSLSLCTKLKQEGYRQYIITNGGEKVQIKKLALSGFDKIMDGMFVSERIGYIKPDVRFFEECFKNIPDFDKEQTLVIGDSLTSDMRGGENAGVDTCWYNPEGMKNNTGILVNYEIKNLQELLNIL